MNIWEQNPEQKLHPNSGLGRSRSLGRRHPLLCGLCFPRKKDANFEHKEPSTVPQGSLHFRTVHELAGAGKEDSVGTRPGAVRDAADI